MAGQEAFTSSSHFPGSKVVTRPTTTSPTENSQRSPYGATDLKVPEAKGSPNLVESNQFSQIQVPGPETTSAAQQISCYGRTRPDGSFGQKLYNGSSNVICMQRCVVREIWDYYHSTLYMQIKIPEKKVDKIEEKPAVMLVTKIEKDETELYRQKVKSYRFDSSEWKERGEGDLVIAKSEKGFRVILHRDLTGKCACNFLITKDIEISNMNNNPKAITVSCMDYSDATAKQTIFAIRFKEEEKATHLKTMLEKGKNGEQIELQIEQKKEEKNEEKKPEAKDVEQVEQK